MTPEGIRWQDVVECLESGNQARLKDLLHEQHVLDVAAMAEELEENQRAQLLQMLAAEDAADTVEAMEPGVAGAALTEMKTETAAEVLGELEDEVASEVLETLDVEEAADLVAELDPDDAVDVLQEMNGATAQAVLAEMEPQERAEVEDLLVYPEDTAGGLMTTDYFVLSPHLTAEEAISVLRHRAAEAETIYYSYVVDDSDRLVGVVSLRDLLLADPATPLSDILLTEVVAVHIDDDQEVVAQAFRKYHYLALPVIDEEGVMRGLVTVDDIMGVVDEEATEDAHKMVGVSGIDRVFAPVMTSAKRRIPWLYVNLATAFLAAAVVSLFEGVIAQVTALAVLMPIVAGQGGNAGSQTLTIIIRGLALGEVDRRTGWRALWKECCVGLLNGLCVGLGVALLAWLWQGKPILGLIIGVAMLLNMVAAALSGVLVPLSLQAMRVDPAVASAIFVTTVTDCTGFLFFLGLASLGLKYLT